MSLAGNVSGAVFVPGEGYTMIMEELARALPPATKLQPATLTTVVLSKPPRRCATTAITTTPFTAFAPRHATFDEKVVSRQQDILPLRRAP